MRWQDADLQGVLNNAVYLTLFEQARLEYFGSLGLLRDGPSFPFLLGTTSVRYLAPIRAGEQLDVRSRVTRLGGKSFDMEYEVHRVDADDGPAALGLATLVWVDKSLQSQVIPEPVRVLVAGREGISVRTPR